MSADMIPFNAIQKDNKIKLQIVLQCHRKYSRLYLMIRFIDNAFENRLSLLARNSAWNNLDFIFKSILQERNYFQETNTNLGEMLCLN